MRINFELGLKLVAVFLISLAFPLIAHAQLGISPDGNGNFCAKVISSKIDQQIAAKVTSLQTDYQTREAKIAEQRLSRDSQQLAKRVEWDNSRDGQFAALRALAQTDAEKTAVAKFIGVVSQAVQTRRTAVDAAMRAFRSGVDQAIEERRSSLVIVLTDYYSAVKAALDKAKTDCAQGSDAASARTVFIAALKTAKTAMQTERSAIDQVGATVSELTTIRQAAISKATDDFKTTLEAARVEVEKSFVE